MYTTGDIIISRFTYEATGSPEAYLCREYGIRFVETVKFPHAVLDQDGILILELRDAKSAARQRR